MDRNTQKNIYIPAITWGVEDSAAGDGNSAGAGGGEWGGRERRRGGRVGQPGRGHRSNFNVDQNHYITHDLENNYHAGCAQTASMHPHLRM